jgi:dimethylhistidine N-methyltransferase
MMKSLMLSATARAMLQDAVDGLSLPEKSLKPKWLYDNRGSALFEQITGLPEYYPTRTEAAILTAHAGRLAGLVPKDGALVELGSGASIKTRTLLDAGDHFGAYVPIDISAEFLNQTARDLSLRYPRMTVAPVVGDFTGPISLPDAVRTLPKVGFFPGSTIGNLAPPLAQGLLAHARGWPNVEGFILGVDLVKDPRTLVAAYDDAQGVTAAFIGNILRRLNAEAGATFDLAAFRYKASWDAARARIDMQLISTRRQSVRIGGQTIDFARDEPIHVSAARKFTRDSLSHLVGSAGWTVGDILTDPEDRFAVALLVPTP